MARSKAPSNLLSLVESDSEDDLGIFKSKAKTKTRADRGSKVATAQTAKLAKTTVKTAAQQTIKAAKTTVKTTGKATTAKAATTTTTTTKPATRDMAPAKRGRPAAATAAAASKVTKPAPTKAPAARRAGGRGAAAAAAALKAAEAEAEAEDNNDDDDDNNNDNTNADDADATRSRGRPVLADRTNELAAEPEQKDKEKPKTRGRPARKAAATTTVEADDSVMDDAPAAAAAATVPKKRGRGRPKSTAADANDDAAAPVARPAKRGRTAAVAEEAAADVSMEEAEVTEEIADEDESRQDTTAAPEEADDMEVEPPAAEKDDAPTPLRRGKPHVSAAASPAPAPGRARHSLAGSASDDAAVRRRLGELTKKHDALESRYRDLKEIGVKEAERNFDRLKKQGDERSKAANDLIASLKAELATYRDLAKEGARAKREWEASEARSANLQAQVGELTTALGNAKAEAKTLATKLAAARTAAESALPPGMVVPGSAIKTSVSGKASSALGKSSSAPASAANARAAVEAMHASTQIAQLKEDLYGDLTGLLVRSAKRDGSRELYDCIQTGRNGSLHFKLCIDDDAVGSDGEDAQFVYTPQLDPSRDAALIEMLPDYLVEEISFPRVQAAKFYKRVMQSLTEEV